MGSPAVGFTCRLSLDVARCWKSSNGRSLSRRSDTDDVTSERRTGITTESKTRRPSCGTAAAAFEFGDYILVINGYPFMRDINLPREDHPLDPLDVKNQVSKHYTSKGSISTPLNCRGSRIRTNHGEVPSKPSNASHQTRRYLLVKYIESNS